MQWDAESRETKICSTVQCAVCTIVQLHSILCTALCNWLHCIVSYNALHCKLHCNELYIVQLHGALNCIVNYSALLYIVHSSTWPLTCCFFLAGKSAAALISPTRKYTRHYTNTQRTQTHRFNQQAHTQNTQIQRLADIPAHEMIISVSSSWTDIIRQTNFCIMYNSFHSKGKVYIYVN